MSFGLFLVFGLAGRLRVFGLVPCPERVGAQNSPIGVVALIDGDEGKVGRPDNVIAARHGFGFVRVVGDDAAARKSAHTELAGGWLIIRITEAMADTGAVDGVRDELYAPVVRRGNNRYDTCAGGQVCNEGFRVGFDAGNVGRVLIIPREEDECANSKAGGLPLAQRKEAHDAQAEDGGNRGEPRNQQTDPAGETSWSLPPTD